jgi:hypothetical protein
VGPAAELDDSGPTVGAAERHDLDRLARHPRVDAREQRAHLRPGIARAQHRIDRVAGEREPVGARVRAREADQHDREDDQREERGDGEERPFADGDPRREVRPDGLGEDRRERREVGEVAGPDARQRAVLPQRGERIDPEQIDDQDERRRDQDELRHRERRGRDRDARVERSFDRGPGRAIRFGAPKRE